MSQCSFLLVLTVLVAASSAKTCDDDFYVDQYLNWNRLPNHYKHFRACTLEILQDLPIDKNDKPEVVLEKIILHLQGIKGPARIPLQDLASLADNNEKCTKDEINRVLEILSFLSSPSYGSLDKFTRFLVHYGKIKFGKCSWDAAVQLEEGSEKNKRAEQNLEKFFVAALGTDPRPLDGMEEDEKVEELKSVDFSNFRQERLDISVGIQYIKNDHPNYERLRPEETLFKFFEESCANLVEDREEAMHIITLADAFGYTGRRDSSKICKLKEYHRLCLSLWREDMQKDVSTFLAAHIAAGLDEVSE